MDEEESNGGELGTSDDAELTRLRAEVAELRSKLEGSTSGPKVSTAASWAGWMLGALVGAVALALIVAFLGGGLGAPCECPEAPATPAEEQDMERQHEALNQFISDHTGELQACFDSWASTAAEARPGLRIVAEIEVEADDTHAVVRAGVRGDDVPGPVSECLTRTVRRWSVPLAGQFVLEIPFEVSVGDSGAAQPTDAGNVATDGGSPDGGAEDVEATPKS
jgi:hypothetical protein